MSGLLDDTDLPEPPPTGPGLFGEEPAAPATANQATAAYRVLARKYRPTGFEDMIGQDAMVRILRNAFALGRIAHAFMLTGVRGVGKTTTARIIGRALNCVGPDGTGGPTPDPCGVCPNCRAILEDRHPDVVEMDAASRTGVDDVREIIDATRFRPMQARTKVFIVDEVHMLSRNAFNALLKTLEEPPPHVKFIFATTEIRKVPVTVLSRCQRFDLRRIGVAELAAHFGKIAAKEGIAIEPAALDLIARAADGSARDGMSLLDQAIAQSSADGPIGGAAVADMLGLADRGAVFDLMEAVLAGKPADAFAITDHAYERGADLGLLLGDLLDLTHALTRLKTIPELRSSADLPEAERTRGAALADRLGLAVLGRLWQMLLKGIGEVETAPDRRQAAEMVLIRLCHVADMPPPAELLKRLTGEGATPAATPGGAQAGGAPVGPSSGGPSSGGPTSGGASSSGASSSARAGWDGPRAVVNAPTSSASSAAATAIAAIAPQPAAAPELAPELAPEPPAGPRLVQFRDVAALVAERREATLHGHLVHSVHLVRFAPPVIELRPEPDAPRDLAPRLARLLLDATGIRWTIALSPAPGEPTLAQQFATADAARRAVAADHPLVRAILEAFPGARIDRLHDDRADAYGLVDPPPELAPELGGEPTIDINPDMPDFAPPDAMPADDTDAPPGDDMEYDA